MKEFRRLGAIRQRGLAKIALHSYLSTLALAVPAVAAPSTAEAVRRVA